jgi:hypothetical protein
MALPRRSLFHLAVFGTAFAATRLLYARREALLRAHLPGSTELRSMAVRISQVVLADGQGESSDIDLDLTGAVEVIELTVSGVTTRVLGQVSLCGLEMPNEALSVLTGWSLERAQLTFRAVIRVTERGDVIEILDLCDANGGRLRFSRTSD